MPKSTSKLALGSANFGLDYGVANNSGRISECALSDILSFAQGAGVKVIDTAQAYGDSESRIGALCDGSQFNFVTKIGVEFKNRALDYNVINSV